MDREDYALFGSKNLKEWQQLPEIKNLGCSECPDFFPLAVNGDEKNIKWVFWGGNGKYLIGSFDGKEFKPETEPLTNKHGGHDYAAMTFSDAPNGRRIQFSWMNTWGDESAFRGMPFNHQFSVPRELTLRTTPAGQVRLYTEPVEELKNLRGELKEFRDVKLNDDRETIFTHDYELFDTELCINLGDANRLKMITAERTIEYNVTEKWIALDGSKAPLGVKDGLLKLRLVVDRTSIEMFAQDGEVQIAKVFRPKGGVVYHGITVESIGGSSVVENAKVWKMKSVWNR
jgi:sucrose-6-phosphate hydrolase SacC (GH32 family)